MLEIVELLLSNAFPIGSDVTIEVLRYLYLLLSHYSQQVVVINVITPININPDSATCDHNPHPQQQPTSGARSSSALPEKA